MFYSYSFSNRKRDLSDILSTVIRDEPRFISNFKVVPEARMRKHEWLEDQMQVRSVTASKIVSGVLTVTPAAAAKVKTGTLLVPEGSPALFAVTAAGNGSITVELVSANGSGITLESLPAGGAVFKVISTPMDEGTINGEGEENYAHSRAEYNTTQIFRKEIVLSGSALAVNVYGSADNQLNRQTAFALADLARDLNRVALFGRRVEPGPGVRGEAGGLYAFAAGDDGLCIDAEENTMDSFLVNDGAQAVLGAGGEPTQILCSPGQARIISNEYRNNLQVLRSDDRRGAYVAVIVNDINGKGMTIMADPDMPDSEAWIIDPAGFGLAALQGRSISDEDATPSGFDGIRRVALGELTFEFRNARQRCCRIKNLQASAEALAGLRNSPLFADKR